MCYFHLKCWSNKTPKNLINSSLFISLSLIIIFGRQRGILYFLPGLWKNEYFVFSTFKDSLFAINKSLMFTSSLVTTVKRCFKIQKQPSRGVLRKISPENMHQIYRKTPIPKFTHAHPWQTPRYGCSPVNLLHIFRAPFYKNTSWWLLLHVLMIKERISAIDKRNWI